MLPDSQISSHPVKRESTLPMHGIIPSWNLLSLRARWIVGRLSNYLLQASKLHLFRPGVLSLPALAGMTVWVMTSTTTYSKTRNFNREIQEQKSELGNLKKQLELEKKTLENLINKKGNVIKQAEQIRENVALGQKYLKKMDETNTLLNVSLENKEARLVELKKEIHNRNNIIAARVRSLFISQNTKRGRTVSAHNTNQDKLTGFVFTNRLVVLDRYLIKKSRKEEQKKERVKEELTQKIQEIDSFKKLKKAEVKSLDRQKSKLQNTINKLKKDEKLKKKALKEMESNALALGKIIKALEKQRKREAARKKKQKKFNKKGLFCRPVEGPLVSKFGLKYHATLKTSTKNLGVEYLGEAGSPIISAAAGEVVYIDKIPGYGRGIILYSGSGIYNIYGNIENIKVNVGQKISGCQEIGTISHKGTRLSRKIYFEVRLKKKPIDPVGWLKTMIN